MRSLMIVLTFCLAALPARSEDTVFLARDVLTSVVGLYVEVPVEAHSARTLGFEREASGVVISDDGLVLTAGYLLLDAETIDILTGDPEDPVKVSGTAIAYDHDSGFGLVQADAPLTVKAAKLGASAALHKNHPALAVSFGGYRPVTPVRIADRRPFAGYWEFMTETAILTMPPHVHYGGAALFDKDGLLVGIGSVFVNDAVERDGPAPGNLFLEIDTLKPILKQLVDNGQRDAKANPWLGMNPVDRKGRVVIARVRPASPAYQAGLQSGDIVMGVGGRSTSSVVEYYKRLWAAGRAGDTITLDVLKKDMADMGIEQIEIESVDRYEWMAMGP